MNATPDTGRRKWVIIPVRVTGNGLYPVDIRLPGHTDHCEGIMLSVVEVASETDIPRMGELSLMFNARSVHPLHLTMDYTAKPVTGKKKLLALQEDLQSTSHISGFYRDYSNKIYTLNIYLACRTKPHRDE